MNHRGHWHSFSLLKVECAILPIDEAVGIKTGRRGGVGRRLQEGGEKYIGGKNSGTMNSALLTTFHDHA